MARLSAARQCLVCLNIVSLHNLVCIVRVIGSYMLLDFRPLVIKHGIVLDIHIKNQLPWSIHLFILGQPHRCPTPPPRRSGLFGGYRDVDCVKVKRVPMNE